VKAIALVPMMFVFFVCGCSSESGALAKAKAEADRARRDADDARAAQAKAAADLTKATADLRSAWDAQINTANANSEILKVKVGLMKINMAYHHASLSLKRPPRNLEELKTFLPKEKSLVSARDKEPFDFAWGEADQPPPALLAWEHTTDTGGGRWVILRDLCLQPSYVDLKLFQLIAAAPTPPKVVFIPMIPIKLGPGVARKDFSKAELDRIVNHVPKQFRQDISDLDLAKELEMTGIAFDFTGGPIQFWLEIEETGQETILPRKYPSRAGWNLAGPEGHVFLGLRRSLSERIGKLATAAKLPHSTEVGALIMVGDSTAPGKSLGHTTANVLWYAWKKHKLDTQYPNVVPREGEEQTLFILTAEETTEGVQVPRKVKLTLKAPIPSDPCPRRFWLILERSRAVSTLTEKGLAPIFS
jgi:hypothetical protein